MEGYGHNLQQGMSQSKDHTYYLLTVLFGQHVYRAYLAWADEAVGLLKEI